MGGRRLASPAWYRWELLAILWLAFFLNQADRQIFNIVLPLIRADLRLSDSQLGLVAMLFTVIFALVVPVAGFAGDRFSRKWICTLSVIFWSGATMLTGLGTAMWHLIAFRSVAMGGGEALFAPANYALIAEYHRETRALALAIHQTSVYLGAVASGFLAGYIGEHYGWQAAFYVFGAFGVALGLLMMARLRDAPPVAETNLPRVDRVTVRETLRLLVRTPTALLLTAAFAGLIFFLVGYLTWMPTLLHEKFGMPLSHAGFASMFYTHAAAGVSVIVAGRLSDRLVKRRPDARLIMQIAAMLATAPFLWLMGRAVDSWMTFAALAGFGLFRGFYEANTYASLYDVIPARYRASAAGMMITFAFLTGAFAPFLLGHLKPTLGLSAGVSWLAAAALFSAGALLVAWKWTFRRDRLRVQA